MPKQRIISNCMAEQIARVVSVILHPFVIVVATLGLVLSASGLERPEWVRWFLIVLGTTVVPLLARLVLRYWRVGSDFDIFHRNQRNTVYVLAGLCLGVLVVVVTLFDAPVLLRAMVYAALPAIVVAAMINRFTKISVHAMLMAGGGAVTGLLYPATWIWVIALTGLQGWSRVYLGKHTPTQVMLGWLVGISAVTAVFARLASGYP
ncbi:MAG: phosphatase PAP2 family protein [Gammaproteobacteria bacterium]|nr:MAG: phosphatase PAP2 family protein [Gammaproteobacteria bacterium]